MILTATIRPVTVISSRLSRASQFAGPDNPEQAAKQYMLSDIEESLILRESVGFFTIEYSDPSSSYTEELRC